MTRASPRECLSIGFRVLVSRHPAIPATGFLTVTPAGLSPAELASLRWTHNRACKFPRTRLEHLVRLETPGEPPPQLPRPADNCTPTTIHLRDTHLQPVDCCGGLFPCSLQPKAHQQVALPSFAFLPRTGSSSSLAIKHQMDVSAVSSQAIEPYPLHYRAAFASSILPPAHPQQRPSRVACPLRGGDTRVTVFRISTLAA